MTYLNYWKELIEKCSKFKSPEIRISWIFRWHQTKILVTVQRIEWTIFTNQNPQNSEKAVFLLVKITFL